MGMSSLLLIAPIKKNNLVDKFYHPCGFIYCNPYNIITINKNMNCKNYNKELGIMGITLPH